MTVEVAGDDGECVLVEAVTTTTTGDAGARRRDALLLERTRHPGLHHESREKRAPEHEYVGLDGQKVLERFRLLAEPVEHQRVRVARQLEADELCEQARLV